MKSTYHIRLDYAHIAIADLCLYYDLGWIITRINVPSAFREKGYGSKLLSLITKEADEQSVCLFLEISPSDGLTYTQLEAWYLRNGFKNWQGQGIYRRKPNVV